MNEKIYIDEVRLFDDVFDDATHVLDYYERELKILEIRSKSQDIDMRKEYARLIFRFVCYYMAFVFIILFLSGTPSSFKMSDSVLITLLGTTTATVISLFAIVVNYLFPKK